MIQNSPFILDLIFLVPSVTAFLVGKSITGLMPSDSPILVQSY